jgi:serine/threonine-protein kinase
MSSLNWRRVDEVYNTAVELPPEKRLDYLDSICAGESPEVRATVETLLQKPQVDEDVRFLEVALADAAQLIEETWFLREGTRLLNRYTIETVVGVGGMGAVYKARDDKFDPPRQVAIKLISAEVTLADTPEARERFKAEANALAQLKDPRFVRIYDIGEFAQHPFLVMEFVEGSSLANWAEARMDPRDAAELIASLASAMSHAHALDIVHRDLTPSNILLEGADRHRPKIADFGIAMKLDKTEKAATPGTVAGTPSYMAPEQASGLTVDGRTDIYMLGAVLYELLTGKPPPQSTSTFDTRDKVITQFPEPPRLLNRRVDRDLQAICLMCLEKDPSKRYQSAEELAKELERWLDGRETKARKWGQAESILRACKRYPIATALIAATAILLMATAVTAMSVAKERKDRLEQESLRSNSYLANSVASHVLLQLQEWSKPVVDAAQDPKLRELLKTENRKDLQEYLANLRHMLGDESPFEDWFVVDREQGKLLAISPMRAPLLDRRYAGRDYFLAAIDHAARGRIAGESVHVSRVFRPEKGNNDDNGSEFAISVAVRDGANRSAPVVGVLVVTLTTDSKMGLVQLVHGRRRAVLIGRGDINPPRPNAEPGAIEGYYVLFHPGSSRGDTARPVQSRATEEIGGRRLEQPEYQPPDVLAFDPGKAIDANYVDPLDNKRQLVGFAQVGNTDLAVMVQQPYDQAVEPHIWSVALVTCIATTSFLGLVLVGAIGRSAIRRFSISS